MHVRVEHGNALLVELPAGQINLWQAADRGIDRGMGKHRFFIYLLEAFLSIQQRLPSLKVANSIQNQNA